ncbi:MAG: extracellular solute-binding protein [Lachnospiraceae bacterium]|nr:extracellular solute-binding protein [Lachnospiraceae bacterium]
MKKLIFPIILLLFLGGCGSKAQPSVLRVALPWSDMVQDPDSNYYINWLEERTGLELQITLIRQSRSEEYLDALLSSGADVDVVMFGGDFTISREALEPYIASGQIWSENGVSSYDNYGSSVRGGAGQILWINHEWLEALGLPIPSTTEEFKEVLKAFASNDLNGNGLADEIPLLGCCDNYAEDPAEFLLNAYVNNDSFHSRFDPADGSSLTAGTSAWRKGVSYCRSLCEEGLFDERSFSVNEEQFCELVNSPLPLVGAFTTASISDVIYPVNPEVMARYMHVAPLKGEDGAAYALYAEDAPAVGAVILGRSTRKEEAKKLLSLMLTEEASLIARYGEEGVDWEFSDGRDVSIYGDASTIVTRSYIRNSPQNKHLNGIGPMNVPERYLRGVTWNGLNSDAEYIDGRAQMSYSKYLPEHIEFHEYDPELSAYTDEWLKAFLKGEKDIRSDEEWEEYLNGLSRWQ